MSRGCVGKIGGSGFKSWTLARRPLHVEVRWAARQTGRQQESCSCWLPETLDKLVALTPP